MKTWTQFLAERKDIDLTGGANFHNRNGFTSLQGNKNIWQDTKTGKVYQFPFNLIRDSADWWIDLAEIDPLTGKVLSTDREPILELLEKGRLKRWEEMPASTNQLNVKVGEKWVDLTTGSKGTVKGVNHKFVIIVPDGSKHEQNWPIEMFNNSWVRA